jgi:drug/metabolite transporter (DMT)-like permease
MNNPRALSGVAFATLLLIALMMGANHVAARLAFNNGVDVATAVVFRSGVTVLVLAVILLMQRVPLNFSPRHKRMLPLIGLLVGVQSLCLYSSVARLPLARAPRRASPISLTFSTQTPNPTKGDKQWQLSPATT